MSTNPFPGMNPYIEGGGMWSDFHSAMIAYIREGLQEQIRPKYNARIEERVRIVEPPRDVYPDVTLLAMRPGTQRGGTATLVADDPTVYNVLSLPPERHIEIIHVSSGEVVTLIELLSPFNKRGTGYQKYRAKQRDILASRTHLLEIDLLANGEFTVAAPDEQVDGTEGWRYIVALNRSDEPYSVECWLVKLTERLPRCYVPLLAPDPDAVLDLPAVFERVFEISGFNDFIDYESDPPIELDSAERQWLEKVLRDAGLRGKAAQNGTP